MAIFNSYVKLPEGKHLTFLEIFQIGHSSHMKSAAQGLPVGHGAEPAGARAAGSLAARPSTGGEGGGGRCGEFPIDIRYPLVN